MSTVENETELPSTEPAIPPTLQKASPATHSTLGKVHRENVPGVLLGRFTPTEEKWTRYSLKTPVTLRLIGSMTLKGLIQLKSLLVQ